MFDLLIRGGLVIDGTGADPAPADIGIRGDTITACADLSRATAPTTLDLSAETCVTPGFIDAHSHSDTYLLIEPAAPSKLYQGITTEVVGNCGASAAPITDIRQLPSDWADKTYPGPWGTVAEYRELLDAVGPAPNVVLLVGHNTLRRSVVGYAGRAATPEELTRMQRLLEQGLDEGARGLTTGLIYAPGMYAAPAELTALAAVAGRRGGLYGSHMRSEGDALLEAIDETIRIGTAAGARIEISHLKTAGQCNWGKVDDALARIRGARAQGIPVAADRYPYTSGATELDVVLPAWFQEGGRDAVLARLADPAQRERVRAELMASRTPEEWGGITIGSTFAPENARFRGRGLGEVADALGRHPVDAILHFCATDRLRTGAFLAGLSEANMAQILAEPYVMLGTDASLRAPEGPLSEDYPHPRAYGAFPKFLRMALDGQTVGLAEAVRKMTSLPAEQFGLADRGTIAKGQKADLTLFDPDTVRDTAGYGDPHRLATGITHVIVNGTLTIADGRLTGDRAGRFL